MTNTMKREGSVNDCPTLYSHLDGDFKRLGGSRDVGGTFYFVIGIGLGSNQGSSRCSFDQLGSPNSVRSLIMPSPRGGGEVSGGRGRKTGWGETLSSLRTTSYHPPEILVKKKIRRTEGTPWEKRRGGEPEGGFNAKASGGQDTIKKKKEDSKGMPRSVSSLGLYCCGQTRSSQRDIDQKGSGLKREMHKK